MAAPATAKRGRAAAPARRTAGVAAPARTRPAPVPRRAKPATAPTRLVPAAAGRAAEAVGGIAESGPILRLTRGRLWIGLIAGLLVGIVALNVSALSLNSATSRVGAQVDELRRVNSTFRADLAAEATSQNVRQSAAELGLALPVPADVRYVEPDAGDAARAAERLRDGELVGGTPIAPVAPAGELSAEGEAPLP